MNSQIFKDKIIQDFLYYSIFINYLIDENPTQIIIVTGYQKSTSRLISVNPISKMIELFR
jgi:hypothetical protein